jgi:hypothetical protein
MGNGAVNADTAPILDSTTRGEGLK